MSDVHHLPGAEEARQQASEWIARLQADDASAEDRARFAAWRQAHPCNARAYEELMATWRQLASAGRTVRAVSFGNAMQAATQAGRRRPRGLVAMAGAAALVLAVAAGWWQWRLPSSYQTGVGEHASVALPDGSRMELNSDSAVRVDYDDGARTIRLERGEAYFTVAHDTTRPFWVVADRTWVRAVGTAFNVYRHQGEVRVTVSEGRVKVATEAGLRQRSPSDNALAGLPVALLEAGQQADLHGSGTRVRSLPLPEVARETSWRGGTVYFENRPLHEVVDEMSRYTPLRIELGAGARDLPVGGNFRTDPQGVEALLSMLHDGLGLQVHRGTGNHVRVD